MSSVSGFYFFMAKSPVKLIENSPLVFHAAVCLNDSSKYSLLCLHWWHWVNRECWTGDVSLKENWLHAAFLISPPFPKTSLALFRAGFSSPTTLIFSLIAFFILRISFSSVSLSVFYCSCPILLQGEFLHANKTSFPTWQRFTHAINLSCVLWIMFRLPMEVS